MPEIIKIVNLTKKYKDVYAANNINLSVTNGEIFGLLGLNGAGKTTIIRALLGMIRPNSGRCYIQNQRIGVENINTWNDVGYIVETPHSYPELTVRENLEIIYRLRGLNDNNAIDWIVKKLKLKDYESRKVAHLSLGNAQRLGIAKAMLHKPRVLILDEPTNGLDPAGIVEIRKLLVDLAQNLGVTILISSHKLDEISKMATNIAIIHKGKLIKMINNQSLKDELEKVLLLDGRDRSSIKSILVEAGYNVSIANINSHDIPSPMILKDKLAIDHPEKIATLLVNAGYPPTLLKVQREDLEHYFLRTIAKYEGGLD
ncbi:MAG: ABC transporter ATP-binding protein [Clostridiales bacterium]|nr:ABC transporter ATP-binding protein [Clostridiales bacterium]